MVLAVAVGVVPAAIVAIIASSGESGVGEGAATGLGLIGAAVEGTTVGEMGVLQALRASSRIGNRKR
jgi:hypothetical protein